MIEKARPDAEESDPALGAFLAFLAGDLTQHPERLRGMPRALLRRARALTRGIAIHHDTPIEGAVAL
jgi:antitoxin PrlF